MAKFSFSSRTKTSSSGLWLGFGCLLAISLAFKFTLLLHWQEPTQHLAKFLAIGVAFDLLVTAQLGLVLGLVGLVFPRAFAWWLGLLLSAWLLFNYLDLEYFIELRTHLPFASYLYLMEPGQMKGSYLPILQGLRFYLLFLLPLGVIWGWLWLKPPQALRRRGLVLYLPSLVLVGMLAGWGANSGVTDFNHPVQNNPLYYFCVRTPGLYQAQPQPLLAEQVQAWQDFRGIRPLDAAFPLVQSWATLPPEHSQPAGVLALFDFVRQNQPNLVLLMMESFNADRLGAYNPKSTLSPQFDRLAQRGVLVQDHLSGGLNTMRGQFSALFGLPPNPGQPVFRFFPTLRLQGLPQIMKSQGFATSWIHAGSGGFDRQAFFLGRNGFDLLITELDFDPALERLNWGYGDHDLMNKALEVLGQSQQPFFSMVLSLTNHHPFRLPQAFSKFREDLPPTLRPLAFSDQALGQFLDQALASPWGQKTLFVITADTGAGLLEESSQPEGLKDWQRRKIPLLFLWPQAPAVTRLQRLSSQPDLLPSLLDLYGWPVRYPAGGQSLFRSSFKPRAFLVRELDSQLVVQGEQGQLQAADSGLTKKIKGFYQALLENNLVWPKKGL